MSEVARSRLDRVALVLRTLDGDVPTDRARLVGALCDRLAEGSPREVWFTLAVLGARLPTTDVVLSTHRALRHGGPQVALRPWLRPRHGPAERRSVEVVTGAVLVDVHHTATATLATGIQRVARQVARRWAADHQVTLVAWTPDLTALRRLTDWEQANATGATSDRSEVPPASAEPHERILVPWGGTYVLAELGAEQDRAAATAALARFGGLHTGAIGYDCVPVTAADTTIREMAADFTSYLAALRHMDAVATISHSSTTEYRGWRQMLAGTGLPGPTVTTASLPVEAVESEPDVLDQMRVQLCTDDRPVVLCVGSHEPRKNHLAVLQAAENAWADGHEFSLLFVGGNAWGAQAFHDRLEALVANGRPVRAVTAMPDDELGAAYRLARCVLFPSLHEGFGLPVAEALACGTPVITSNFGSMAEIAHDGGALLVDPRDDDALTRALTAVVTDDGLHARLVADIAARPPQRTWDHYTTDVWDTLVTTRGGTR